MLPTTIRGKNANIPIKCGWTKSSGEGLNKTFIVRKISNGVGVERIFPFSNPNIDSITVLKKGKVRRAKLYYLRGLVGKKAKIKEDTRRK